MSESDTVSDVIKHIAAFGQDGIEVASKNTLSKLEETALIKTLKRVSANLGKPKKIKKIKKDASLPTPKEIFEGSILPQIRERVARYIINQASGIEYPCILSLDYKTDFVSMTSSEMATVHLQIKTQESTCSNLLLLLQFHLGDLYLAAFNLIEPSADRSEFFMKTFSVAYTTALRYIWLSCLLKKYPKLLICGLSSTQLMKHMKNLRDFLTKDTTGLSEELSSCVEIVTSSRRLTVEPSEINVPEFKKVIVDPDVVFLESLPNRHNTLLESAKPFEDYMDRLVESGELPSILSPTSTVDMLTADIIQLKTESIAAAMAPASTVLGSISVLTTNTTPSTSVAAAAATSSTADGSEVWLINFDRPGTPPQIIPRGFHIERK